VTGGYVKKERDLDLGGVFSPTRDLARGADRWDREVEVVDDVAKLVCPARRVFDGRCGARAVTTCGSAWRARGRSRPHLQARVARWLLLVGADQEEAAPPAGGRRSIAGDGNLQRRRRTHGETANQRGEEKKEGSRRERESPGSRWWCR
jgi:hypothetical protein